MGLRRLSRKIALAALFQLEAGEKMPPVESFRLFCSNFGPEHDEDASLACSEADFERALDYVREVFEGVTRNLTEIDRVLTEASEHWRVDRMSRVDRNVMRLAVFEMLFKQDVPSKVSINEAIDLGKEFGTEESGAFINGILDRIHRQLVLEGKIEPAQGASEDEA